MDLVNEKVVHETFGKGNVVNYNSSYIKISFESGGKRFVFPDVFKKHLKFINQEATKLVDGKIAEKEKEEKKKALILEKEKEIERKRQYKLEQERIRVDRKIHPKIQSVFWCDPGEEDKIFEDWQVFTGEIKSGEKKGQPRRLARMDENSACLITKRESSEPEADREILGVFLAEKSFNGRECEDGYIKAHPDYRLRLSKDESEKMLFWNYYIDEKFPKATTWNSGRQRYFDNIWLAQILKDIVAMREESEGLKDAENFLGHFCRINLIDEDNIPEPEGALTNI